SSDLAVADDAEHAMGDGGERIAVEARTEHARRERHAHTVAEALAERTGRRLDARRDTMLGMAGRAAAELAEALQFLHRQVVAGEVEHRVEQHRAVPRREDEAIAAGPPGILGLIAEESGPEHAR